MEDKRWKLLGHVYEKGIRISGIIEREVNGENVMGMITTHDELLLHADGLLESVLPFSEFPSNINFGVLHRDDIIKMSGLSNKKVVDDNRPTWDEYFMAMAVLTSTRGTCPRLKVGAVLTRGKRQLMTGYNGSSPGEPHCTEVGCLIHEGGCKRTNHAERNVFYLASKLGISTDNTTLYVTHYPCPECMQAARECGVTEIVYMHYYKHRYDNTFHTGMNVRQFNGRGINLINFIDQTGK